MPPPYYMTIKIYIAKLEIIKLENLNKKISFIIGPSHTARLRWHVRDGVVKIPISFDRIFGYGGIPIWSLQLINTAISKTKDYENIALLVPDFRFGNSININNNKEEPDFIDGHTGIDPKAINADIDAALLIKSKNALRIWNDHFKSRIIYVFWCLFGRQVHDRLAGKHIKNGKYEHPTFNYNEIVKNFPSTQVVDLSLLLCKPMHEISRLYIDKSSHPSQVGYAFLNNVLFEKLPVLEAYDQAVNEIENELISVLTNVTAKIG